MRLLYFTSNEEDYLSDGLLHGLRSLLGEAVVDFPKNEAMYRTYPNHLKNRLYGHGFSLYGTLDDINIDRFRVFKDLRANNFDIVVFSDIWRQFGYLLETFRFLQGATVAIVDGSDSPLPFPYSRHVWRLPAMWMLPRYAGHLVHFKREVTAVTKRYATLMIEPIRNVKPISFSFPEEKIVATPPVKLKLFPTHIVDPELTSVLNGKSSYAFSGEADYYQDLQQSRFGITTKRAGWDCMRHYEIAANGAVPCFRNLAEKPPSCAPHGLHPGNCLTYRSADELLSIVRGLSDHEYRRLQRGALEWAHANTTRARATAFLKELGRPL